MVLVPDETLEAIRPALLGETQQIRRQVAANPVLAAGFAANGWTPEMLALGALFAGMVAACDLTPVERARPVEPEPGADG